MSRILAVLLFAAIFAAATAQYYSAYVPSTYNYGYSNLGYAYGAYPSYAGVYGYGYPTAYTGGLAYYKK